MSTKAIISSDDDHTLYEEIFDDTVVYLQIENCTYTIKVNHFQGEREEQVTIAFPAKLWEEIVAGYCENR